MNCRGRNIYIDSLRGVSILMIMFLHAFAFVDSHDFGREITIALSRLNLGVPFFFVISGFVISLNHDVSLKNKTGLTRYAISRGAKIIPLYYIFLCLTYFFIRYVSSLDSPLAIPKNTANFADIKISSYIAHAFFLQGFNSSELNTLLDGDWSLVNEVYFYVLFPFMAMWAKDSVQRCFLLLILSYLVAIFFTIYWIRIRDISGGHIYYTFPVHLSEFVLGMTAYRLLQKEQVKVILSKYSTYLVGLISVLMIGIVDISSTLLGPHHLYSLCFALILMVFGALDSRNFPSFFTPLATLGQQSYALYLLHILLLKVAYIVSVNFLELSNLNAILLNIFLVLPLTFLLSHFVFHRLDEFFVNKSKLLLRGVKA